jgi:hypothetical protein
MLEVAGSNRGTYRLHLQGLKVVLAWLTHQTLQLEAIYFFETSGSLRTTRRYNPEEASLLFDTEDGGDMFLRNVGLSPDYTALQPRRSELTLSY